MVNFDLDKCTEVANNFARHLREFNEIKAAEAIESFIKALSTYVVE